MRSMGEGTTGREDARDKEKGGGTDGTLFCSVLSPNSAIPDRSKSQINVTPWSLVVSSGQLTRSKPAERPGGEQASISSK